MVDTTDIDYRVALYADGVGVWRIGADIGTFYPREHSLYNYWAARVNG